MTTRRRTIRIEVTDQSDELEDHFTGPREREHATLVWEFEPDPVLDKTPAELVAALAAWLDGNGQMGPTGDQNARGGS